MAGFRVTPGFQSHKGHREWTSGFPAAQFTQKGFPGVVHRPGDLESEGLG